MKMKYILTLIGLVLLTGCAATVTPVGTAVYVPAPPPPVVYVPPYPFYPCGIWVGPRYYWHRR